MAFRFDRNSLQGALEILSDEIGVPIEIVGQDMQVAGITRCSSIAMDLPKQTVEELLQAMLKRSDPDGRLVYTVRPNEQGVETISIAVRHEAEKRGEELFPEFTLKKTPRPSKSPKSK